MYSLSLSCLGVFLCSQTMLDALPLCIERITRRRSEGTMSFEKVRYGAFYKTLGSTPSRFTLAVLPHHFTVILSGNFQSLLVSHLNFISADP